MKRIIRTIALGLLVVAALAGEERVAGARAQPVPGVNARVVATNIPGASAIAQVGTFVTGGTSDLGRPNLRQSKSDSAQVPVTSNPARSWTRHASWLAARRISARRCRPAAGGKVRSCRLIQAALDVGRPAQFRHEWRPGGDARRRCADVQREQPILAQ